MTFNNFIKNLQLMEDDYNEGIDRKFNVNTCTKYPRKVSRYLTYFLYNLGFVRGEHALFAHFVCDVIALIFVALGSPLLALTSWLIGHILDNVDGDLARARGESDAKWGEIDCHLHLITNMAFWVIIGVQTDMGLQVMMILAARVICESHRGEKKYSERWGERSKLWYWLALPTNVSIIYMSYVVFALLGAYGFYVVLYMFYYYSIFLGQSLRKCLT